MTQKYFYVCVVGTKLVDITSKIPEGTDPTDVSNPDVISKNGKMYIRVEGHYGSAMTSLNGAFVPTMIEDYFVKEMGLEQCVITFVRDMTQEDYEHDVKYIKESSEPKPLDKGLMDEIDDLVGRVETGDLRVYKPTTPDVPETKEKKDLRDLGLPDNLFDDPYGE